MHEMWNYVADAYCMLAGYRPGHPRNADEIEPLDVPAQRRRVPLKGWLIGGAALLSLLMAVGTPLTAAAQSPCTYDPPCPETPLPPIDPIETIEPVEPVEPIEPIRTPVPDDSDQPPSFLWSGYEDGRLNPEQGEYYTIYCFNDLIHVVRVVPVTEEVKTVPFSQVTPLEIGGALDLGDNMTLVHNAVDTLTVYGSNGNSAPNPGEKAFSMSQCLERGGGDPETSDAEVLESDELPVAALPISDNPDPDTCEPIITPLGLLPCDFDFDDLGNISGLEYMWRIALLCLSNPFAVVAIVFVPGMKTLRRKRKPII